MHVSGEPGLLGYLVPLSSFTKPCPKPTPSPASSLFHRPSHRLDDDNRGCPPLCFLDNPQIRRPSKNESWIALVQRGNCPFVEKAREGLKLGAKAVIVGGTKLGEDGRGVDEDDLVTMYSVGMRADF